MSAFHQVNSGRHGNQVYTAEDVLKWRKIRGELK